MGFNSGFKGLNKELLIAAINHKLLEAEKYWTFKMCEMSIICTFINLLCSLIKCDIYFYKNLNVLLNI